MIKPIIRPKTQKNKSVINQPKMTWVCDLLRNIAYSFPPSHF